MKALRFPPEQNPNPYNLGIKKGLEVTENEVCKASIAIENPYRDEVSYDVMDLGC